MGKKDGKELDISSIKEDVNPSPQLEAAKKEINRLNSQNKKLKVRLGERAETFEQITMELQHLKLNPVKVQPWKPRKKQTETVF
jgi:hypothetical protein